MSKVEQAQAFFADARIVTTVRNTYRPEVDGTRLRVDVVGKSFVDGVVLDEILRANGDVASRVGSRFRCNIPKRASEVVAVSDTEATFKLGATERLRDHTVTYRKDGAA